MKKLFILFAFVFIAGNTFSQTLQEKDVPDAVKTQFKSKFPAQTATKWEFEDSLYQASFTNDGMEIEAAFDALGTWKETEWLIPTEYAPAKIKEYIATNYAGYKIKEVCITDKPVDGKMYKAEITKKKTKVDLVFTLAGEFKNILKEGCDKEKKGCDPNCPHHQTENK